MLKKKFVAGFATLAVAAALSYPASAEYDPEEVAELLYDRGYYDILFTDTDPPNFRVNACKRGVYYRMRVSEDGEILDRKRRGTCKVAGLRDPDDDVHVEAPYVDVRKGRDGVRIKAPFVDIRIP